MKRAFAFANQRRVERAKDLLMRDSTTMAEVAAASVSHSQSHMARQYAAQIALKRSLAEASAS